MCAIVPACKLVLGTNIDGAQTPAQLQQRGGALCWAACVCVCARTCFMVTGRKTARLHWQKKPALNYGDILMRRRSRSCSATAPRTNARMDAVRGAAFGSGSLPHTVPPLATSFLLLFVSASSLEDAAHCWRTSCVRRSFVEKFCFHS